MLGSTQQRVEKQSFRHGCQASRPNFLQPDYTGDPRLCGIIVECSPAARERHDASALTNERKSWPEALFPATNAQFHEFSRGLRANRYLGEFCPIAVFGYSQYGMGSELPQREAPRNALATI
jgi:hypothetical protein